MIVDRALRASLFRRGHPSPSALVDGVRGVLSRPSAVHLSKHLADCPQCRARLEAWNAFVVLAERERRLSVPEAVLTRVRTLARPQPRVAPLTVSALRRDLQRPLRAASVRGRSSADQFVYEAE